MGGRRLAGLVAAFLVGISPAGASWSAVQPGTVGSHRAYIEEVRQAQASHVAALVQLYDEQVASAPDDVVAALERCRFFDSRLFWRFDSTEQASARRRECAEILSLRFSDSPDVRVYLVERSHGDEAIALGKEFLDSLPPGWEPRHLAAVHAHLAVQQHNRVRAGEHAAQAMAIDPSLDLRVIEARGLIKGKKTEEARRVLREDLVATKDAYQLDAKAAMLVELGDFESAVSAYREIERRGEYIFSRFEHARALASSGRIEEARAAYRTIVASVATERQARDRLEFEMEHGDAASAREAYDALVDSDLERDLFGQKRLALLFTHPGASWKLTDLFGLVVLTLTAASLALVPGVVLLPVSTAGWIRRRRGTLTLPEPLFRFDMRQAWLTAAVLLIATVATLLFFPDTFESTASEEAKAHALLCSAVAGFAGVLVVTRRQLAPMLARGRWGIPRSIATGFLLMAVLAVSAIAVQYVFEVRSPDDVEATLKAMSEDLGILVSLVCVALLVPIYEEIVYRGVFLSAFQTQVSFRLANIMQAVAFGASHADVVVGSSAFLYGLAAGEVTMRSGSLRTAIFGHVLNNALWCLAVVYGSVEIAT